MNKWIKPLKLEMAVAQIIHQQALNGVQFDIDKAHEHVNTLETLCNELYDSIRPYMDMEVLQIGKSVLKPFLKAGGYSKRVTEWYGSEVGLVWGPFSKIEFTEPDLGSRQKVIKQLLKHGWNPTIFTDGGKKGIKQPKLTVKGKPVDSLFKIEAPVGKAIAKWYTYQHRASQIRGWINNIRPDGRLSAQANSCGTNTYRMRHKIVVNVPKADPNVIFGYEMRDLFIALIGHWLVGHDASGLEARIMGHYTTPFDDGEFAHEVLNGDIHSKNTRIFYRDKVEGLSKGDPIFDSYRSKSKNGFYALVYGAQPNKLAETLGISKKEAKHRFEDFWRLNVGLGKLRELILKYAERGRVPGLDGREIRIRSEHSALNAVFQSAGAIVMKVAMVFLDYWAKEEGLGFKKVIDMHDESEAEVPDNQIQVYQMDDLEALKKIIDPSQIWMEPKLLHDGHTYRTGYSRYGELAVKSVRKAGEYLNLRCELDAEYMIGHSWAEVH